MVFRFLNTLYSKIFGYSSYRVYTGAFAGVNEFETNEEADNFKRRLQSSNSSKIIIDGYNPITREWECIFCEVNLYSPICFYKFNCKETAMPLYSANRIQYECYDSEGMVLWNFCKGRVIKVFHNELELKQHFGIENIKIKYPEWCRSGFTSMFTGTIIRDKNIIELSDNEIAELKL